VLDLQVVVVGLRPKGQRPDLRRDQTSSSSPPSHLLLFCQASWRVKGKISAGPDGSKHLRQSQTLNRKAQGATAVDCAESLTGTLATWTIARCESAKMTAPAAFASANFAVTCWANGDRDMRAHGVGGESFYKAEEMRCKRRRRRHPRSSAGCAAATQRQMILSKASIAMDHDCSAYLRRSKTPTSYRST